MSNAIDYYAVTYRVLIDYTAAHLLGFNYDPWRVTRWLLKLR